MNKNKLIDVTNEFVKKAKPGVGSVRYEKGFDFKRHKQEKETAIWLLDTFGGEIVVLKEKYGYRIKSPDFKWNNKFWELKGVSSKTSLDNLIRKSIEQIYDNPGGVIVDLSKNYINMNGLYSILSERLYTKKISKIFIIVKRKQKLIKVYYKE